MARPPVKLEGLALALGVPRAVAAVQRDMRRLAAVWSARAMPDNPTHRERTRDEIPGGSHGTGFGRGAGMNATLKSAALAAGFAALIAGSLGCFTAMAVSSASSPRPDSPIGNDTIIAAGRPDAALAQRLGTSEAVAFLGERNTYMLVKGGEELLQIATQLDGARVDL